MNLRTYTLIASLAAIIGLLVGIGPLLRNALEYRSPGLVSPQTEFASLEEFVAAKAKSAEEVRLMLTYRDRWYDTFGRQWESMYVAAKEQHVQVVRSKAFNNLIAYGALCSASLILLVTHLIWARRLAERP